MGMNKSKFAFFVILLLMSVVVTACNIFPKSQFVTMTTTPIGTIAQQPDGEIGDQVRRDALSIIVLSVEEVSVYEDVKPKAGNKYIAIELEIESMMDSSDVNPLDARLQDSDGNVYFLMFGGKDPFLQAQYGLSKGAQVKGWITYEVPETAKGFWFIYEPIFSTYSEKIIINLDK